MENQKVEVNTMMLNILLTPIVEVHQTSKIYKICKVLICSDTAKRATSIVDSPFIHFGTDPLVEDAALGHTMKDKVQQRNLYREVLQRLRKNALLRCRHRKQSTPTFSMFTQGLNLRYRFSGV